MERLEKFIKMIQMDTISNFEENIVFDDFLKLLKDLFPSLFKAAIFESFNGCFLLKWNGLKHDNPILFMNHHDVVDVGNNWLYPPFSGKLIDGKIYGRGTLDTKGGLYSMLEAAEELISQGFTPNNDIYFVSDNSEETSGINADICSAELLKRHIKFNYVLDEGGFIMYEPVSGAKGYYAMIGVGEKGYSDLKFVAKSHGGHASTPPKNTPWIRLSKFMLEVEKSNLFEVKATDTVLELFKRLSKTMSGITKLLLSHPYFFKPLIKLIVPKISPTTNAMFRSTICFTTSYSGTQRNSIPEYAYVNGNMRYSNHQGFLSSYNEIKKIADKYDIAIEILDSGLKSPVSSFKEEGFKFIEKAVNDIYPEVISAPYVMNGASDSRYFSRVSDNVYRFVPFVINDAQLDSIHGDNEYVTVDSLNKAIEFYKILMRN